MSEWTEYVRQRLQLPALREAREAEIVEDLARQLEDAYRDARLAGTSDREARTRAEQHVADWEALARELAGSRRARVGTLDRWTGQSDDREIAARGQLSIVSQLRQDVFYGARALKHQAGLTIIAVLSLALGIGANTAIFSVVNALLFRTLSVRDPEQLVVLSDPEATGIWTGLQSGERSLLSYAEFQGLRDRSQALDGLFAVSSQPYSVPVGLDDSDSRPANILMVSGTYFPTLGIEPLTGHVFGPPIDLPGASPTEAVVSYRFWSDQLQRDPGAVGRIIRLRHTPFKIVGVLPAAFTGIVIGVAPDIWVPIAMQQAILPGADWLTQPPGVPRRTMFLQVVGRLRPGVSLAQVNASVNLTLKQNLEAEATQITDPDRRKELVSAKLVARNASRGLSELRGEYGQPLYVLMALVALLLLLACGNVANLLLSRATGRERELAVRVALGAKRGRLVRQLLTESVLLAGLGAAAGLGVARLGTRVLLQLVSGTSVPVPLDARLDGPVLAFTAGIALATGLLFGLAPALNATRPDVNVVLRGSAANIAGLGRGTGRWPLPRLLVGAQVALSLLLLITAGLFVRSLEKLGNVALGYDADHLVMFRLAPAVSGYRQAEIRPLFEDLLGRLATTPGVRAVSLSDNGLFYGGDNGDDVSFPDEVMPSGKDMNARFDAVGAGYFATLGIPVLQGRDVRPEDGTGAPSAWLNQTMAEYFFPGQSPIGRRMVVHYSFGVAEYEIQGVVADSRSQSVRDQIDRRFYVPFFGAITKPHAAVFEIRTAADSASVVPAVRKLIREVDPRLDPPVFRTVAGLIDLLLIRDRLTARLSSLFSGIALVLACVGLYGVLSYSVSRRVGEIGVRLAFGADRGNILRLVLEEALAVTMVGVLVGLGVAWFAARLLSTLLFGLTTHDPIALVGATSLLVIVATLAAAVPAWRASRTDPLTALRTN